MGATPSKISFSVCSYEEAMINLDTAEKADKYLIQCEKHRSNLKARSDLNYFPYKLSLSDQLDYRKRLETIFSKNKAARYLLESINQHTLFAFLMPTADSGMPHTRPNNTVCLPHTTFIEQDTVIHELCHIHQRIYNNEWIHFFESTWNWKRWYGKLPQQLEQQRRFNPDTIDYPLYIFAGQWVSIPIFLNVSKPNLRECSIWFYNIQTQTFIKTIPDAFSAFRSLSVPLSAYEHPREMSAYIIQNFSKYLGESKVDINSTPLKDLMTFMSKFH